MTTPLLLVENLRVEFSTREGLVPVLDDVSFSLQAGGLLSMVGESGCGKSMTALAIMGLLPQPAGRIASGRIFFAGEDLAAASPQRLREIRGNDIAMIFQEPMTSLNPVYTIGEQIAEGLRRHQGLSRKAALERAGELMDAVKIPNPRQRLSSYPHQLSGGQRQRVMIAIALGCEPKILIADEPTTALDVTVQAEIFDLLWDLHERFKMAIILITHDIAAVARMAEEVMVMYAGRKVEQGRVADILARPAHPYTQGLIGCIPHVQPGEDNLPERLAEIPGIVPSVREFGQNACLFAPRCAVREESCRQRRPLSYALAASGHAAACHLLGKDKA